VVSWQRKRSARKKQAAEVPILYTIYNGRSLISSLVALGGRLGAAVYT